MAPSPSRLNGIPVDLISKLTQSVREDRERGRASFEVASAWKGGARSDARVERYELGGRRIERDFTIRIDEPEELGGSDTAPNPQELLMAAFNACLIVGYVAQCSAMGVNLDSLEVRTRGTLDLAGFLGLDPQAKPGPESIEYEVHISGDGTPEQYQEIHEIVGQRSPNGWSLCQALQLDGKLVLE